MVCDKELKQITRNHLVKHNITVAVYKERFPDAHLQDESIILRGDRNPFFGHHHTDELKEWQSKHFTGKKNPSASAKISKLWKDPNGVYRKMIKSDAYCDTMSKATQAHWDSPKSDFHRQINSENFRLLRPSYEDKLCEIRQTPEYRQRKSNDVRNMWASMSADEKDERVNKHLTTMMNNGSLCSKGELALRELLKTKYPNTKYGVWIHKSQTGSKQMWNIDLYVPQIDTYVQFDGVYWHGLDRPIELIKESSRQRDKVIYKKWLIDRAQDEWFAKMSKRLVRITDVEFKKDVNACLRRIEHNDVSR